VPPPLILEASPGRIELTAVWLVCLAMTLGPLLFILTAQA
jgi:hypothetical protein